LQLQAKLKLLLSSCTALAHLHIQRCSGHRLVRPFNAQREFMSSLPLIIQNNQLTLQGDALANTAFD
jgi:hypothetical protein